MIDTRLTLCRNRGIAAAINTTSVRSSLYSAARERRVLMERKEHLQWKLHSDMQDILGKEEEQV